MALLFNPPLNDHEASVFESLKKAFGGTVVNPKYLAAQHRDNAEQILANWCDKHEQRHWPSWVSGWWLDYEARQNSKRRAPSAGVDTDQRGAGEGLELRPGVGCSEGPLLGGGGRDGATAGAVSPGAQVSA